MADPADPRIADLLGRAVRDPLQARAALVGFPSDEGVRRNGGRVGAAAGPAAIRAALRRFTRDAQNPAPFVELVEHTVDLGDFEVTGDLERDQERLAETVAPLLATGVVPIVLGGGHETSFGHFLGYASAGLGVGILNWDAHPDVRPLRDGRGHSGSPFRQALEHPSARCRGYTMAGLLPHSVASAHLEWLREKGGTAFWRTELDQAHVAAVYADLDGPVLVSFDLDAVDGAWAPGVSAPSVGGLDARLWQDAAEQAGHSPHVSSIDVVELNPAFDRDAQTARLAALTVWRFLRGLMVRG